MQTKIPFFKMHGCGNDYIFLDFIHNPIYENPSNLSRLLSNRHYGIGSDGLVIIEASNIADFKMRMFNSDGSEGKMCGNAIRCLGKYVYETQLTSKDRLKIETKSGIHSIFLHLNSNQKVASVTVLLPCPSLSPSDIPMNFSKPACIYYPFSFQNKCYPLTALSVGNPHAVFFASSLSTFPLKEIATSKSLLDLFAEGVNVSAAKIINKNHIALRVYERGSGETLACGTASCAAVMACILTNKTNKKVLVTLPGGTLLVTYDKNKKSLFLTGNCVNVYQGFFYFPD